MFWKKDTSKQQIRNEVKNADAQAAMLLPHKKIGITSVDLRDGQQSLFATRFKTEDMVPILDKMDQVGFEQIEMWGGATFDVCVRYLNDDPWDRVRIFKKHLKKTPIRMLLRGQNLVGYRQYADDIVERFVAAAAKAGIDIFQTFDGLNDIRNCETAIKAIKKSGKELQGVILYTVSPVHTTEKYVAMAKEWEKAGATAVHLVDMAGQMTPYEAYKNVKAVKEAINIPLHFKCHTTGGMADMAYWEAIRAGADVLGTDFSAISYGTSMPAVESWVAALSDTPASTGLDLNLLTEINDYFAMLKEKYKDVLSKFTGVDARVLQHQIPGGMLSNLESQLKMMNAYDRMDEVFVEAQTVRKDLGYPPLATPFSQMVGAQATTNVLTGQRYKMVSREVQNYVRGMYGRAPGPLNPDLVQRVLNGEAPVDCRPGSLVEPEYEKARQESAGFARTEEDILTYALFPATAPAFLKKKYGLE